MRKGNLKEVSRLIIKEINNLKTIQLNHDIRTISRKNDIQIIIGNAHRFKNRDLVTFMVFLETMQVKHNPDGLEEPNKTSNSYCKTPCHIRKYILVILLQNIFWSLERVTPIWFS